MCGPACPGPVERLGDRLLLWQRPPGRRGRRKRPLVERVAHRRQGLLDLVGADGVGRQSQDVAGRLRREQPHRPLVLSQRDHQRRDLRENEHDEPLDLGLTADRRRRRR